MTPCVFETLFPQEWKKFCEEIGHSVGEFIEKYLTEFYESPEIEKAFEKFMKRKELEIK